MEEISVFRKSLILGIIILFFGVSVVPVNSTEIQNNLYDNSNPSGSLRWNFCRFNLTFFGEVYRVKPIMFGNIIFWQAIVTYDPTFEPNTILKITNWYGKEVTYPLSGNNTFIFFLIRKIDTDMPEGDTVYGGYLKGRTLSLSVYSITPSLKIT